MESERVSGTDESVAGVEANYYCGIMSEAVTAAVAAHDWIAQATAEGDTASGHECQQNSGILARYAFMTACIAAEAGANALLETAPNVRSSLYRDLERLQTLNKYELYALVNGTPLERGAEAYRRMKIVVKGRNDLFHPKRVRVLLTSFGRRQRGGVVPLALDVLGPDCALPMVADILQFVAWVVCDTCGHPVRQGASKLSRGIQVTTPDLYRASEELGFDIRSFGISGREDIKDDPA